MLTKNKRRNYLVNISRFLLLFVGIDVLITSILLLLHISISVLNLFIGLGVSIAIYFCLAKDEICKKRIVITASCGCIVVSIIIVGILNEIAYDGNLYHKFAVGILKMGYNPVYERVEDYLIQLRIPIESWYNNQIWVGCFPKASWYFESTIYAVTGWIESSKIFNILIFIASFGICYNYFSYKLNKKAAYILSFLLTVTPTSLSMFLTFYLDGAMGNLLITSIVLLMSITDDSYGENKYKQFLYLGVCIILCGNLKSTGLAYIAVYCFSFFLMWIFQVFRREKKGTALKKIGVLVLYYITVVAITVLVVGAGSYIANIKNYGNILYPVGGLEGFDVANNLKSVGMEDTIPFIQMMSMIFVRTSSNDSLPYLEWKIPFSFDFYEIKQSVYDVIRGGTGIFYSGILCIAIVMFLIWSWKFRKDRSIDKKMSYLIILVSILLLCIVPAGGQTRYSPYIFYFVTFTLYLWMLKVQERKLHAKLFRGMQHIMIMLLILNLLPFTNFTARTVFETIDYEAKYRAMKEKGGVYIDTRLPGLVFNFIDRDIDYIYDTKTELTDGEMRYFYLTYNYFTEED